MRILFLLLSGSLGVAAATAGAAPLRFVPAAYPVRPQSATVSSFSPAAGLAGATVTVVGTGFTGASAVTFNGVPAAGFSVAAGGNRLTAVVPVGATSGPIGVTVAGTTVSSAASFGMDLVVGDGVTVSSTNLPMGTFRNVTVRLNATARLSGPTQVNGLFWVQQGGSLYTNCHVLGGPGQFTLNAGATLYICNPDGIRAPAPAGGIQVVNRRTFSPNAIYVYNGTTQQETGDGLPASVNVLVIDNSSGGAVSLSRPQTITGLLMLGQGTLRLGAHDLRLASTPTRTASVSIIGPGSILYDGTGRARMQRAVRVDPAFPYYSAGFRHYGSPMTNSQVQELAVPSSGASSGFAPVVNAAYNALPAPGLPAATTPNVFGYDQNRLQPGFADFATGWYSPGALTDALVPGRGYSLRIPPAAVVELAGELNQGPVATGALATGFGPEAGWHLLANPYPSDLDWQLVQDDVARFPAGLDGQISVYEPTGATTGFYRTYNNGVGTGGFNGLLAPMQGFFAYAAAPVAAPGLVFQDAYRSRGMSSTTFHRAAPDTRPRLSLTLTSPAAPADETVVYFETGATADAFDSRYDARKQPNTGLVPNVATLAAAPGAPELAINGLPTNFEGTVPLVVEAKAAGTHALAVRWTNPTATQPVIVLLDRLTGTRYPLTTAPRITFSTTGPERLTDRFALEIGHRPLGTAPGALHTSALQVWPNPATGAVQVSLPAGTAHLDVLDVTGRHLRTVAAADAGPVTLTDLAPGLYLLRAGAATQRLVVE